MGTLGTRPHNPDSEQWENHLEFVRLREEERQRIQERFDQYKKEQRKKRKTLSKEDRMKVYNKYNGHCAYCGCELEYKDMQVDHAVAIQGGHEANKMLAEGTMNELDNLEPTCRQCNFYKGTLDIEGFRNHISNVLQNTCIKSFQVKLALKYGILTFNGWDGKFYFEKFKNNLYINSK